MTRIALDVDSTLSATLNATFDRLSDTEKQYTYTDIESWDWPINTFGLEAFLSTVHDVWVDDAIAEVQVMEDGLAETSSWLNENFSVDVVTAQPPERSDAITEGKLAWLEHHDISFNEFVPVDPNDTKADLGYDVFIDDKPALVEEMPVEKEVMLRDHRYNRGVTAPHTRVDTVAHAAQQLSDREDLSFDYSSIPNVVS